MGLEFTGCRRRSPDTNKVTNGESGSETTAASTAASSAASTAASSSNDDDGAHMPLGAFIAIVVVCFLIFGVAFAFVYRYLSKRQILIDDFARKRQAQTVYNESEVLQLSDTEDGAGIKA